MISIETLERWLTVPVESEKLEFKEASQKYRTDDVLKYCVALSNEGGGHLVLGVKNTPPRQVTGTQAFASVSQLNKLKLKIVNQLHIRVDVHAITHPDGRVLVFEIPTRPVAQPLDFNGCYLMRAGESVVAMTPDRLKEIFAEDMESWLKQMAVEHVAAEGVTTLLSTKTYFKLLGLPHPDTVTGILSCFETEGLIKKQGEKWGITNMAAILLANKLREFPPNIYRKAPRVIIYEGNNKLVTRDDKQGAFGYAVAFEKLVKFVHHIAPQNRFIEETIRKEYKMFPLQALRELIANALIHQDFSVSGTSVMIEMYSDRVEISNPGTPIINVNRFIDGYKSRNERLADVMRRFGICEEKGSGINKVIRQVEVSQLPAPDFREDDIRTTVVLFAHVDFSAMTRQNRIRACYQHCCLRHVFNESMTNHSLRERFRLDESKISTVSQIISQTKAAGLIKSGSSELTATRYARYLPFWA
ncbi:ATP-binding protein [Candidatus Spongiihabitans sp.]|uniref:ATP-binding protein n=1 Tax=Candidatus Spongiihabitans sp. TaxID=3101308 RepID=UPI003C6FA9B1